MIGRRGLFGVFEPPAPALSRSDSSPHRPSLFSYAVACTCSGRCAVLVKGAYFTARLQYVLILLVFSLDGDAKLTLGLRRYEKLSSPLPL